MRNDDIVISSCDIKAASPSLSPRDSPPFSCNTSSGSSSPSDLRRRLQDLPSPDEFTLLADRVAALGRRISRKRERFLRLHGVASRIEEKDESEQREGLAESCSTIHGQKDARARRRARLLLEDQSSDEKGMVISRADDITGPTKLIDDDKRNLTELSVDQSARERDYLRLPAIEVSRRQQQARSTSVSEPTSTRFSYEDAYDNGKSSSRDIGGNATGCRSYRNFAHHDNATKSTDRRSVSPFSLSNIRPRKVFGGYRPPSGVIMKNLSSGSESESAGEAHRRQLQFTRKLDSSYATLEMSSPELKVTAASEPTKKMPIMSARSDITRSILPNLLPSSRAQCHDDFDRRIFRDTARDYATTNRAESEDNHEARRTTVGDGPVTCTGQINRDRITPMVRNNAVEQADLKYEAKRDDNERTTQSALSNVHERDIMSELGERVIASNERIDGKEVVSRSCNIHGRIESRREDMHDGRQVIPQGTSISSGKDLTPQSGNGSYCTRTSRRHYNNMEERRFESNRSNDPSNKLAKENLEDSPLEMSNRGTLGATEWEQVMRLYRRRATKVQDDSAEDPLSSQTSELLESEGHSRSSYTPNIHVRNETLAEDRKRAVPSITRDNIDTSYECNEEIITIMNVPALALNSQDISYSTSAGSKEYSAMRTLDTHALIKALSDVSVKRAMDEGNDSRKCEDFYWKRNDISCLSPDLMKEETCGGPLVLPKRTLSRVPSRIPIRISNSRTISPTSVNKISGCCEASDKVTSYEKVKLMDENAYRCVLTSQNEVMGNIVYQQPGIDSPYSQVCELDVPRFKNEMTKLPIVKDSGTFIVDDAEPGSLISSNAHSPRSTSCNNYAHSKARYFPARNFSGRSCPPAFHREAAYSANRDFSKIDDDVRSRSDRSTSRRSMETVDITSATESSCRAKCANDLIRMNNESSRVDESRNMENVTWRTEDECVSINDEENPDRNYTKQKNYQELYDDKQEELRCQKVANNETNCRSVSPKAQLSHLNISSDVKEVSRQQPFDGELEFNKDKSNVDPSSELTKVVQSQSLMFQVHRTQEIPSFAARISSSTLNLGRESKKIKKSQERFPFTISETLAVPLLKRKDAVECQTAEKSFQSARLKNDEPEEKHVHELKMHPSLTRLAISGLEDTTEEILCCAAQDQKEDERVSSSKFRIKGLAWILSSRLKRKRQSNIISRESTKIIYENRACQVDSKANSCSGASSTEDTYRLNLDKSSNDRWTVRQFARSNPMLACDGNALKKTESFQEICQQRPHRRCDRDGLWVRGFKEVSPTEEEKNGKTSRNPDEVETLNESSLKDRYSVFLAKNVQSVESHAQGKSNTIHDNSLKEQQRDIPISGHIVPSVAKSRKETGQEIDTNIVTETNEIEEESTGCLCLRLCRLIASPKHRLPIMKEISPSRKEKRGFRMRKRKK